MGQLMGRGSDPAVLLRLNCCHIGSKGFLRTTFECGSQRVKGSGMESGLFPHQSQVSARI